MCSQTILKQISKV